MVLSNRQKPSPLYAQVKQHIVGRVAAGEWPDGARLPSEHELTQSLGVSRMTVHRALRELSAEGVVSRIQGVGTFISRAKPHSELIEIRDIAEDIVAQGHRHHCRLVRLDAVRATMELATPFGLRPGAKILHSVVVHSEDDTPIQIEERFISPAFAPDYLAQDFSRATTNRYLQSIASATELEHVVFAVPADAQTADLLHIAPNDACLRLMRRTWVGALPATQSLFTYPGSRYSLGSRYKLPGGPA